VIGRCCRSAGIFFFAKLKRRSGAGVLPEVATTTDWDG
jgi:hypothetical protein